MADQCQAGGEVPRQQPLRRLRHEIFAPVIPGLPAPAHIALEVRPAAGGLRSGQGVFAPPLPRFARQIACSLGRAAGLPSLAASPGEAATALREGRRRQALLRTRPITTSSTTAPIVA
jgi:hypothetical protein